MSLLDKFRTSPQSSDDANILEHLCDLLNTKREFGTIQKDYGLSSFLHFHADQSLSKLIARDVRACIERYEKRIKIIDIIPSMAKKSLFISFEIHYRIHKQRKAFRLSFNPYQKVFNVEEAT